MEALNKRTCSRGVGTDRENLIRITDQNEALDEQITHGSQISINKNK